MVAKGTHVGGNDGGGQVLVQAQILVRALERQLEDVQGRELKGRDLDVQEEVGAANKNRQQSLNVYISLKVYSN